MNKCPNHLQLLQLTKYMFILFIEITYCETCPWRKCDELPMLNFNMSCICKNKRHKKKKIIVCRDSYSFTCTSCAKVHKHHLQLTEPLSLYCKDDIVKYATLSRTYNRQTINFCDRCINHRLGQNIGFCWYCNQHIIKYIDGRHIILYNELDTTKHNGVFKF